MFLYFLLTFFSFMESFVNEQKILFGVDFLSGTSDHRFQCHMGGRGQNLERRRI